MKNLKHKAKKPRVPGWTRTQHKLKLNPQTIDYSCWEKYGEGLGKLTVISSLAKADAADGSGEILQWHLTVSGVNEEKLAELMPQFQRPLTPQEKRKLSFEISRRPDDLEIAEVLDAFNLIEAEEDNHVPGITRAFWLALDPRKRGICECKSDETTVREPDGFEWQNDKNPDLCRRCVAYRLQGKGQRCPEHIDRPISVGEIKTDHQRPKRFELQCTKCRTLVDVCAFDDLAKLVQAGGLAANCPNCGHKHDIVLEAS